MELLSKRLVFLNVVLLFAITSHAQYMEYVDPKIGTAHCRWFHFTPGAVPFGMAKPAPSTNGSYGNASGWEATGYDYRDSSIEGFANFHEFQVGGIVIAPITGSLQTVPGRRENPDEGYRSRFDRNHEFATAGYYSVRLKDYDIRADLTATKRVAFHSYHFPAGKQAHIIFDIGNRQGESGQVKDAKVYILPDGRIEGYVTTLPLYVQKYQPGGAVSMYFSAVIDAKSSAHGVFRKTEIFKGDSISGVGAGLYITFDDQQKRAVTIKVGLSYTSIANARLNLEREAAQLTFSVAATKAKQSWEKYLGRIKVETKNTEDKVKFYTGLYHALLGRGLASDVNGAYPKNDGTVGQIPLDKNKVPLHHHYNTDAVWGAFWNLTQLWALAYPEYYSDFVKSQLLIYKDAGWLADGIANSRFVSGVGTNFVSLVIASAYMVGIRDFDINTGYAAALKNELDGNNRPNGAGKLDTDRFLQYGFVNHIDKDNRSGELWQFSASHTLEYSFSAYAVAQWAKKLGKKEDEKKLFELSNAWKKIFDPSLKLVRPKWENGQFIGNFKPTEAWRGFQEGNAVQYTFYVPHDPEGLVQAMGKDSFNIRLNRIFEISRKNAFGGGKTIDAFAGLEFLYNHGNQPCLHIPWLFNFSGRPSLTQKWVRTICNEFYGTEGVHGYGYGQDEDQGQLGAWYVISSIGLFDVKGLTDPDPAFGLGSPLFDKVTIELSPKYFKGKKFIIETRQNSKSRIYVSDMKLDGKKLERPFISFADVAKGGRLVLNMSSTAKDDYGAGSQK